MKKLFLHFTLFFSFFAASTLQGQVNSAQAFLDGFTSGAYRAKQPASVYHCKDGLHYTTMSDDGTLVVKYEYTSGKAVDTLFNIKTVKACPISRIHGYSFSSKEDKLLVHTETTPIYRHSFTTNYYVYQISRRVIEPLSENGPQQLAQFSPDGRNVAFVRDNNLFLKKLDFGTESAITEDGAKNKVINGMADWVYEEEFGLVRYFEWSADSRLIAFVRFNEEEVKEFSFQWMNDTYPVLETFKYPHAGTTNSTVSLHVFDIANRTVKQMQVGEGNDIYFTQLVWTNRADDFTVVRMNREQTHMELLEVNGRSGVAKVLFNEYGKVYIDYANLNCLTFLSDGRFICMSERDGYRHLYLFKANGLVDRKLTNGNWDVMSFYGYDEKSNTCYFLAAAETPIERNVYKVDAKGRMTCLDKRQGMHTASFSTNFRYAIHQFNNATTPNIYSVINNQGGVIRVIEDNAALAAKFKAANLPTKEFFNFTTDEGVNLNAWIVKPQEMEAGKAYPLVMVQYSGPNSQEVLNRWRPDWEYYMAQEGYVVACVDGRGTGGRGWEFRTCTYKHLGILESADQIASARYFGNQSYIDASRIAIWGWSFGGFMTLMTMTRGEGTFKSGISIAPVTDWQLYNTAYTERYMSLPQMNDQGYRQANLLLQGENLQGNLLIVHGSADDNVHAQNTYLYTEALVEAGKAYDMQIYTNKNHSILGAKTRKHLYELCTRFIKNNL